MADNEDFSFEEESFLEAEAPEDSPPDDMTFPHEESRDKPAPVRQTSLMRILLLVLLLVVLGSAAFYQFVGVPKQEPPAVPATAKKQRVSVPASAATVGKEQFSATVTKEQLPATTATSQPAAAAKPVADSTSDLPQAAKPEPVKSEVAQPAVPVSPAKTLQAASSHPATMPAVTSAAHASTSPAATAGTGSAHFTLRSGAYLLRSSLAQVEKRVRKLGYQPVLTPVRREVAMTRLRVGTYQPAEAAAKLASLAKAAPDSFVLTHDGKSTVYVGSYLILDQARRYADQLYGQGIRVEEEPATVMQTLQLVSFGEFTNRKEAAAAAAKARAANLKAAVIERR